MVGDSFNRGLADCQNTSTPKFSAPPQHIISELASIRPIEQKERYKKYRKLFELMVVISYNGPEVVGLKCQPILVRVTKHLCELLSTGDRL